MNVNRFDYISPRGIRFDGLGRNYSLWGNSDLLGLTMNKSKRQLENWPAFNSSERESRSFFVVRTEQNQYGYPIRPSNGQKTTALRTAGKVPLSVSSVQSIVLFGLIATNRLPCSGYFNAGSATRSFHLFRFSPRESQDTCSIGKGKPNPIGLQGLDSHNISKNPLIIQ